MRLWLPAVLAACWTGSPAPEPTPAPPPPTPTATRTRCSILLFHMLELEFAKLGGGNSSGMRAVFEAKREEFVAACMKMSRVRVECAIAAPTLDDVAKCERA